MPKSEERETDRDDEADLHVLSDLFDDWVTAANTQDLAAQMRFYAPRLPIFYARRNVPRTVVRAEKRREYDRGGYLRIVASDPEIAFHHHGQMATMHFRKRSIQEDEDLTRQEESVQELRWQRTDRGWKIVGERELREGD